MELIIVMALLAIVAAILVPMFLNTTDRARLRSDIQSARVVQSAMDLYRLERGRAVQGATYAAILENLDAAGYINARNARLQTEGANWVLHNGRIYVGIPANLQDLYDSLTDIEREMVRR